VQLGPGRDLVEDEAASERAGGAAFERSRPSKARHATEVAKRTTGGSGKRQVLLLQVRVPEKKAGLKCSKSQKKRERPGGTSRAARLIRIRQGGVDDARLSRSNRWGNLLFAEVPVEMAPRDLMALNETAKARWAKTANANWTARGAVSAKPGDREARPQDALEGRAFHEARGPMGNQWAFARKGVEPDHSGHATFVYRLAWRYRSKVGSSADKCPVGKYQFLAPRRGLKP